MWLTHSRTDMTTYTDAIASKNRMFLLIYQISAYNKSFWVMFVILFQNKIHSIWNILYFLLFPEQSLELHYMKLSRILQNKTFCLLHCIAYSRFKLSGMRKSQKFRKFSGIQISFILIFIMMIICHHHHGQHKCHGSYISWSVLQG